MNASKIRPTPRKVAPKKVDIQKLTPEQLAVLPENVFLASLKPNLRKSVVAGFRLKGIL